MIYLIGGPPRCGKTTLARRLAALTHAPWVQTDYLEMAFSAYMPPDEYEPVRLDLGPDVPFERRNDLRYARYSAEEIIAYYRGLAAQAWPGLQAFIEYALFDEEDLIVEGYHIEPKLVRQFLAADPTRSEQVRTVFLYRQDIEDILAAIKRGGGKNDWVLGRTQEEATFERIARMIAQYGAIVRAAAEQSGFPAFNVDYDLDRQLGRALTFLRT